MTQRKDDTSTLKTLGSGSMRKAAAPGVDLLEAFPNRYPERLYVVSIAFPEFTSLCPVTGQPDFGLIRVEYIPDKLCVESKSFKLYMFAYRSHPAFMETLTNAILEDITALLRPHWCQVKGIFAPRGATAIHVYAEEYKNASAEQLGLVRTVVADWRLAMNMAPGRFQQEYGF